MGSRFPSHKLSSGLYVSGRPEQPKEKPPTMSSSAMPYTGGDIKTSGELGKMFDIPMDGSRRKSGPIGQPPTRTSSFGGAPNHSGPITSTSFNGRLGSAPSAKKSNSGPLNKHGELLRKISGPQNASGIAVSRQNSGPLHPVLSATGLITSGPLNSSRVVRNTSGQLDSTGSQKMHSVSAVNSQAVTNINMDDEYSFYSNFPKPVLWSIILLFVMGFIAGGFILGAVHNPILMIVVVALFGAVGAALSWNAYWGKRAITSFIAAYPDADLRTAKDGEFVKVSGVITCGNVPLESSFHKIPRCVYTSTALYEYRGWNSKPANDSHRRFTWGIRSIERRVVDFYISDLQSGLRALVKTGYGAKVNAHVDDSAVIDMNPGNRDASAEMVRWLGERNLSSDDRVMRVREGYVKEGSAVSVMGVVHRNNNLVMILPPPHPVPTPCQWARCILPATLYGIVLHSEDPSKLDVIPV